jgi:ApaG protein
MSESSVTTQGIRVDVVASYSAEQSAPEEGHWFFVYQITILNSSMRTVQLISREWRITNAEGKTEYVRGPGVVGQQPVLRPAEGFQYVSGCPLDTAVGTMEGAYQMVDDKGEPFEVEIGAFALIDPMAVN